MGAVLRNLNSGARGGLTTVGMSKGHPPAPPPTTKQSALLSQGRGTGERAGSKGTGAADEGLVSLHAWERGGFWVTLHAEASGF